MGKYSITDWEWIGSLLGGSWFLSAIGLVLYVWVTSIHPFPNRPASMVFYYAFLCLLVVGILTICFRGFTYRWAEMDKDGLVLHEGYYAVFWKHRVVPRSQIRAVERFDRFQHGFPASKYVSGIRVCLTDGTAIVLAEKVGAGEYQQEVVEVQRALGIF